MGDTNVKVQGLKIVLISQVAFQRAVRKVIDFERRFGKLAQRKKKSHSVKKQRFTEAYSHCSSGYRQ